MKLTTNQDFAYFPLLDSLSGLGLIKAERITLIECDSPELAAPLVSLGAVTIADDYERCTVCGKGRAGRGGICTQCRNNKNHAAHESKLASRIEAIVEQSNSNPPKIVARGRVITGRRVG